MASDDERYGRNRGRQPTDFSPVNPLQTHHKVDTTKGVLQVAVYVIDVSQLKLWWFFFFTNSKFGESNAMTKTILAECLLRIIARRVVFGTCGNSRITTAAVKVCHI